LSLPFQHSWQALAKLPESYRAMARDDYKGLHRKELRQAIALELGVCTNEQMFSSRGDSWITQRDRDKANLPIPKEKDKWSGPIEKVKVDRFKLSKEKLVTDISRSSRDRHKIKWMERKRLINKLDQQHKERENKPDLKVIQSSEVKNLGHFVLDKRKG